MYYSVLGLVAWHGQTVGSSNGGRKIKQPNLFRNGRTRFPQPLVTPLIVTKHVRSTEYSTERNIDQFLHTDPVRTTKLRIEGRTERRTETAYRTAPRTSRLPHSVPDCIGLIPTSVPD